MPHQWKAHLALFLVALFYGANYTVAKIVLDDEYIQPLGFIVLRAIGAGFLFLLAHGLWVKEKVERKDIGRLVLCGLFGVTINQTFFFSGLKLTQPIHASLIMLMTPILVLLISALLIGERITTRKITGIIVGAIGAWLLIAYGEQISFSSNLFFGDVLILANATSYAIYLVLVKKLMQRYHPITVVKWVFIFGGLFVLPVGVGEVLSIDWSSFTREVWLAVVFVIIFVTFLTYLFNAYALTQVNASVVSAYIYLQPLVAGIIGIAAGKDKLTASTLLAGCLIFTGVYLVTSSRNLIVKPEKSSRVDIGRIHVCAESISEYMIGCFTR